MKEKSQVANRQVVPNKGKGWAVKVERQIKPESTHRTQGAAEDAAKRASKSSGGGEVVIHRSTGVIRDSDTVAPGNDPSSSRDTKH
jgi:hypothetical protein